MEPLGEGRQGTTFRGVDRATKRQVAIKVVSLAKQSDWKAFDLFEREVAVLKTLDHPKVPRYIDSYASEATGDFFVVMTLVEGTPLSQTLRGGARLPPGGLRGVLEQGLSILDYLHGLSPPVVHRDIKPDNLILSTAGDLSLVDFGGVRAAARGSAGSTVIGTFGYMAPEQLHGEATPAVDIFALGATIAAIHAGREADALAHDGLRLDVESLGLPEEIREVVGKMIEPDPRLRPRSVAEVRALLATRPKRLAGPPEAPPSADSSPLTAERAALVQREDLPASMRVLAATPFPFSILVWLLASLASVSLVLFEVAVLPVVTMVALGINRSAKEPEKKERLDHDIRELQETVAATRNAFAWIANETTPGRERP